MIANDCHMKMMTQPTMDITVCTFHQFMSVECDVENEMFKLNEKRIINWVVMGNSCEFNTQEHLIFDQQSISMHLNSYIMNGMKYVSITWMWDHQVAFFKIKFKPSMRAKCEKKVTFTQTNEQVLFKHTIFYIMYTMN